MTKRDFEKSDGVGLALFAAAVFCAVVVVKPMFLGANVVEIAPGTDASFVKLIAAAWVGAIGAWPTFAFTAPVAVLGARMFLFGPVAGLVRHIVGAAFVAASLALVLGSFSDTAGGAFGARIGGNIAGATHVAFGVLIGVLALASTVWFVWLRHDALVDEEPVNVRNPELDSDVDANDDGVSREEAEALLPKELPRVAPLAARASVPPPSPYPEDVRKRGEIPAGARPITAPGTPAGQASTTYRWTAPGARSAETPAAAPVRAVDSDETRTGDRYPLADELPAGVQALASGAALADGTQRIANLPSASWEAETNDTDEDIPVDAYGTPLTLVESLRAGATPDTLVVDAEQRDDELGDDELDDDEAADETSLASARAHGADDDDGSDDETFADDDDDADDAEADADETVATQAPVIVEAELFAEVEAEADRQFAQRTRVFAEPAAPAPRAYSVRAELGALASDEPAVEPAPAPVAPRAAAWEVETAVAADPVAEELVEEEELEEAELVEAAGGVDASVELETVESEAAELDTDDDELESDLDADEADDDDEADELDADEFDAEEELFTAAVDADDAAELEPLTAQPAGARHELDETAELDEVDEVEASDADDEEDDADEDDDADETLDDDDEATDQDDDAEGELAASAAPHSTPLPVAGKLSDARTRGQELLDFDLRNAAAAAVPASSVFVTGTPERDIVLTPPAVSAERSIKTPPGKPEGARAALLAEIGCLFIDRKRVAVSMLQRQYSMEFDDACGVLDELQSMGLIGPYLGGQSRDILLTREEWLEKVGAT